MAKNNKPECAIIIPNWNGEAHLAQCLQAVEKQLLPAHVIVVDNGSADGSVALIEHSFPRIEIIKLDKNYGFTGGVNAGITKALADGYAYIALLNNDAIADPGWLKALHTALVSNTKLGIVTAKIVDLKGKHLDSTGEFYTSWGLSFSRGRGEDNINAYDKKTNIFGASGGASLYRATLFQDIGLFDNDYFAYYEDIDLSFRAQLRGWKIQFVPDAVAHHHIGLTSGKIKGFTTYQTLKNLPILCIKNVPGSLLATVLPRLWLAHTLFFWTAVGRGQAFTALRGVGRGFLLLPKKLLERHRIQKKRTVHNTYIRDLLIFDLPPQAHRLRSLRNAFKRSMPA